MFGSVFGTKSLLKETRFPYPAESKGCVELVVNLYCASLALNKSPNAQNTNKTTLKAQPVLD